MYIYIRQLSYDPILFTVITPGSWSPRGSCWSASSKALRAPAVPGDDSGMIWSNWEPTYIYILYLYNCIFYIYIHIIYIHYGYSHLRYMSAFVLPRLVKALWFPASVSMSASLNGSPGRHPWVPGSQDGSTEMCSINDVGCLTENCEDLWGQPGGAIARGFHLRL